VASAAARGLGLGTPPFQDHHVHLNAVGWTMLDAMKYTLANLRVAQNTCAMNTSCAVEPLTRCALNQDRWDEPPSSGVLQERYHAPHCNAPWHFQKGDVFTLLSFHKAQMHMPRAKLIWMHTVLYAFYTSSNTSQVLPQSMLAYPSDLMPSWEAYLKSGYESRHYDHESYSHAKKKDEPNQNFLG